MRQRSESWCVPHLERTRKRVPATRFANGTPMCQRCFRGVPIDRLVEEGGSHRVIDPARTAVGITAVRTARSPLMRRRAARKRNSVRLRCVAPKASYCETEIARACANSRSLNG